jgi:hypothetical protein
VKEAHEQCTRARPLSLVGRQRRLIVVALAAVSCHLGGSGLCTCTPGRCRSVLDPWQHSHAGFSGTLACQGPGRCSRRCREAGRPCPTGTPAPRRPPLAAAATSRCCRRLQSRRRRGRRPSCRRRRRTRPD